MLPGLLEIGLPSTDPRQDSGAGEFVDPVPLDGSTVQPGVAVKWAVYVQTAIEPAAAAGVAYSKSEGNSKTPTSEDTTSGHL
jgi:hypothetical protein